MQATPRTAEMGLMTITKQPRIYFANRDPVREALQAWRQGTYPGQHLWGTVALEEAGYEVVYSNFGRGQSALERVSRMDEGPGGQSGTRG